MPKISVITATHAPGAKFLMDARESVAEQALPQGWDLEWVVQEDGRSPQLQHVATGQEQLNIRYSANGNQLGPGATRNLALARAHGDLIQVLDHDDVLLPGGLALKVKIFEQYPIHWAVTAADDLLDDGSRKSWDSAIPFGLVEPGVVNEWAAAHQGNWPVHCAGLMMRTDAVRALGGWSTTPVDEDIILFSALSELGRGWNDEAVTWLYRQHEGQTTRSPASHGLTSEGRRIALQRVQALRNVGLKFDCNAGLEFGLDSWNVEVGPGMKEPAELTVSPGTRGRVTPIV